MKLYQFYDELVALVEKNPHILEYEVCMELPTNKKGDEFDVIVVDDLALSDYQEVPGMSNEQVFVLKLGEPYEWSELEK